MSRTLDAIQLAKTKLKTRRIRLTVSVVISSLLFCLLMAAALTVHGAVKSVENFRDTGLSNRYIAQANPYDSFTDYISDAGLVKQAKALQKQVVAKKKAESKRLDVPYDPASEQPFVQSGPEGPNGPNIDILNTQIPEVNQLIAQKFSHSKANQATFKKVVSQYGAFATYKSLSFGGFGSSPPNLQVIKNNKENFDQGGVNIDGPGGQPQFQSFSQQWTLMSPELVKPFLMAGQNFNLGKDGSIPVIAPYSEVESILGLKSLPASASSTAKLERLKEVRTKAAGLKFKACYRNQTSSDEVQSALQQKQQIANDKNKEGFQMPDFVQDLPSKPCGPVITTRDVRPAAEKQATNNQTTFDQEFGKPKPASKLLTMRVVGLNSDTDVGGGSISVVDLFKSILQSSLGTGWFSPLAAADKYSEVNDIFEAHGPLAPLANIGYYAEFKDGNQLKTISDKQYCDPSANSAKGDYTYNPGKCLKQGKYFGFSQFGSSSVAIDQFNKDFSKIFRIVAFIMAGIAALVLLGTIGRIIADSRRETAVFRAIGAKRRDIVQIYLIYTLMLSGLIIVCSLVIGYLISAFINLHYSASISVNAIVAFNINDLNKKFSLTSFDLASILFIAGLVVLAALLAASLPLLTNMRRNPIRDMRDER